MVRSGNRITRRRFLRASGTLGVGLALSACATLSVYHTTVREGRIAVEVAMFPNLAKPGGGILLDAEGLAGPILLINLDGTDFSALSAVCTHLGCRVRPSGRFLRCPCHGSTYDLQGRVIRGPAQRALRIFQTRTSNGVIEIVVAV